MALRLLHSSMARRCSPILCRVLTAGLTSLAALAAEPARFRLPAPVRFIPETPVPVANARARAAAPVGSTIRAHPADAPDELWEFTDRVALQVDASVSVTSLLEGTSLVLDRTIRPGLFVLQAPSAAEAWRVSSEWSARDGVISAHPVVHPPWVPQDAYAAAPNDEFFRAQARGIPGQWYLENRDPDTGARLGADINVRPAWAITRGAGVTVGVADTGVRLTHPDLRVATAGRPHFNFDLGTSEGGIIRTDNLGAHGTAAAGLIGATANNAAGMSGIAPEAGVASWVIYNPRGQIVTNEKLGDVFRHAGDRVAVQSHSWAPPGRRQVGPSVLEDAGIEDAWTLGRGGLGTVIVRSAGNDRSRGIQAGDDGYANDPRAICVGAARMDGSPAGYSEPGACLLVAAPAGEQDQGGLFTTDLEGSDGGDPRLFFPPDEYLSDYRWGAFGFSGTSAATPIVAGVAALALSVNPGLSARDVQQVLLLSARHWYATDPGLARNRAGLPFTHNLGFGVVDAGAAVALARHWSNRPPAVEVTAESPGPAVEIPDAGLRVELEADPAGGAPLIISGLPGTGIHPESATDWLPMVDLGLALTDPPQRIEGHGALIERGQVNFSEKLARAAAAGAAFAVVYNAASESIPDGSCPGGEQLCVLAGTDYSPIPALFIRRSAGLALRDAITAGPARRARLHLEAAVRTFEITRDLQCEHVGVRLRTDHSGRGDLRVTLRSPSGTVSVLQRYNADTNAGPADWTYWSTQHFFEPSAGTWELRVTDEAELEGRGRVLGATLRVRGVPILDTDHDGLDDDWERRHWGDLAQDPEGDPDGDGASNLLESLTGGNPRVDQRSSAPDLGFFNDHVVRVSWPGGTGKPHQVEAGSSIGNWSSVTRAEDRFPVAEVFLPAPSTAGGFFRVTPAP
ncbi:MAG: S8 family serine peptidase [Verrucomicrobiales bacterium]|nr:S8 family serine peptidase [Verrucomicrobiales bacterium]